MNINLKHMIEDSLKENKKKISDDKSKKKHIKKSEMIIMEQNKKRNQQLIDKDNKTINFLLKNLILTKPYDDFDKIKTEEGRLNYKLELFSKYYKKPKYLHHTLNLYFHLKDTDQSKLTEKQTKTFQKFQKKLQKYDYKQYMFDKLGHLLPPLNFWDKGDIKLDPWQQDIIQKIINKESILIRAPTSSGKTFISMAAGIFHKKVLYVCPAEPVAYQIAANFKKMNYKVHFLIDGHAHLSYSNETNIFIGVPDMIEKYIYKIGTNFDYVVFDEIHNLNQSYENLIHLFDSNFLALSATISNSNELLGQLKQIYNRNIYYFEYNQRFINQQRHVWTTKKLKKIHPCICLDTNDFNSFDEINFTPNDLANLYSKIEGKFEDTEFEDDIDDISPDNYFKEEKLLTLDDSKEYEKMLKNKLRDLYEIYPYKIDEIIHEYKEEIKIKENSDGTDFIELFQNCKKKDLLSLS